MNLRIPSLAAVHGVLNEAAARGHSAQAVLDVLRKPLLPLPAEATWLLVGLGRRLQRQEWVARIVEEKLGRQLNTFGQLQPSETSQQAPAQGVVPGHPAWEYEIHGAGCTFRHRVDGDTIDVQFLGGVCEAIDPASFTAYLRSLRRPPLLERMLRRSPACAGAWQAELPVLSAAQLVLKGLTLRLTDEGRAAAEALAPLAERLDELDPSLTSGGQWQAAYLAAAVGDSWLAWRLGVGDAKGGSRPVGAGESASDQALEKLESLAFQTRRQRQERLGALWAAASRPIEKQIALQALADLGRSASEEYVLAAMQGDLADGVASAALDLLVEWNDPLRDSHLMQFIQRGGQVPLANRSAPHAQALRTAMKLLIGRRPGRELDPATRDMFIAALTCDAAENASSPSRSHEPWRSLRLGKENPQPKSASPAPVVDSEDALLLYVLDPRIALDRLSRALRSDLRETRQQAAVALAAIDDPLARELLFSRLADAADERTIEARAALSESSDPKTWRKLTEWEAAHPQAPSADPPPPGMRNQIDRLRDHWGDCLELARR